MTLERDKFLVSKEFKRLMYACRTRPHKNKHRDRAMFAIAGLCGLRVMELVSLRFGDLYLGEKPPFLRVWTAKKKKSGSVPVRHRIPIPTYAAAALRSHVGKLEPGQKMRWMRVFPLTTRQVGRLFKTYCALAGLRRNYSVHALRHFRGMTVYEKTKDLQLTKDALRHSSLASTQVYMHTAKLARLAEIGVGEEDEEGGESYAEQ